MLGPLLVRREQAGELEEAEQLLRECVKMGQEVCVPTVWHYVVACSRPDGA